MFRKITRLFGIIVLPLLVFAAGCAKAPEKGVIPGAEGLPPDKIVERLFAAFQFSEIEGAEKYFATEIPEDMASGFVKDFFSKHRVGEFRTKPLSVDKTNAVVKVSYIYTPKDPKTGEDAENAKKAIDSKQMQMVKEGEYWKIRRTGFKDFDQRMEKHLFMNCLNSVMDATIAEEKLRQARPTYSNSVGALMKYYKFDDAACKDMRIEDANKKTYMIIANTRNTVPCEITGNTDRHFPQRYEDCAGK